MKFTFAPPVYVQFTINLLQLPLIQKYLNLIVKKADNILNLKVIDKILNTQSILII
jgi:hypothetical protein